MVTREMAEDLIREFASMHKKGPTKDVQNVTRGEMPVLAYLIMENVEPTPSEISTRFDLSTARVANTLNSLEKKGFIERIHDAKDRRKVFVHITPEGKAIAKEKYEEAIEHTLQLLESLGEDDAKELIRLVKKIKLVMQDHEQHCKHKSD